MSNARILKGVWLKTYTSLVAVVTVTAYQSAQADVLAGPIANPSNGHTYYMLTQDTWTASEAQAISLGGHLVTINDAAENDWVRTTFGPLGGPQVGLWLGFTDMTEEGDFRWVSGEPVTFTSWASGEPNDSGGGEDFAYLYATDPGLGFWNDVPDISSDGNGNLLYGVVEVVNQGCPGDADGDGTVGIGDFLLVLAQWGPCPPNCLGDVNGDGVVGILRLP